MQKGAIAQIGTRVDLFQASNRFVANHWRSDIIEAPLRTAILFLRVAGKPIGGAKSLSARYRHDPPGGRSDR